MLGSGEQTGVAQIPVLGANGVVVILTCGWVLGDWGKGVYARLVGSGWVCRLKFGGLVGWR